MTRPTAARPAKREMPIADLQTQPAILSKSVFSGPIAIADDDAEQAAVIAELVSTIDLEPMVLEGPFPTLEGFTSEVMDRAAALVCDHKLSSGRFAEFYGAEAVAALYGKKPAVLLTSFLNTEEVLFIRRFRRSIPAVLARPQLDDPQMLHDALLVGVAELQGFLAPERLAVRTIARIDSLDTAGNVANVFVESWQSEAVPLQIIQIPEEYREKILSDLAFTAYVNTAARENSDLYFERITPAPEPVDDI